MTKRKGGWDEWAQKRINICDDCENGCKYCFQRWDMVARFGLVMPEDWGRGRYKGGLLKVLKKNYGKRQGVQACFGGHDIYPSNYKACEVTILKLLEAKNKVLITTKPVFQCVKDLCKAMKGFEEQVLWRFTIGSQFDKDLSWWEPRGTRYQERKRSLVFTYMDGWETSVSDEPNLTDYVEGLYHDLAPWVSHTFWRGTLNKWQSRVIAYKEKYGGGWTEDDQRMLDKVLSCQTEERLRHDYNVLHDEHKIRWKIEVREILGLESSEG